MRIAVSECVEARTEEDILCDTVVNGADKRIFGVAAACDEEGAETYRERTVRTRWSAAQLFCVGIAEDGNGDGVVEDERWRIVELVSGSTQGHAKSGFGGARLFHTLREAVRPSSSSLPRSGYSSR